MFVEIALIFLVKWCLQRTIKKSTKNIITIIKNIISKSIKRKLFNTLFYAIAIAATAVVFAASVDVPSSNVLVTSFIFKRNFLS